MHTYERAEIHPYELGYGFSHGFSHGTNMGNWSTALETSS
ncbi:Hypothetical protein ACI5QL_01259 [Bacillus velezensis]